MSIVLHALGYAVLSSFILIGDRITKLLAIAWCQDRWVINQYVACDFALNRGISWGLFHSYNSKVFFIVTLVIAGITIAVAFYGLRQLFLGNIILAEVLIMSGSASNLFDRFYYKGVVDFIELSYNGYTWPIFNVADICIVIGTFIMIMEFYRK